MECWYLEPDRKLKKKKLFLDLLSWAKMKLYTQRERKTFETIVDGFNKTTKL